MKEYRTEGSVPVEETLKERDERYGPFDRYATIIDRLKNATTNDTHRLQPVHSAAIDMIFCKIARILNGDPNYSDNWHDIAGYATLVEKNIKSTSDEK